MLPAENPTAPEAWKPIPEFAGYEASDWGRIRSFWKQRTRFKYEGRGATYDLSTEFKILKNKVSDRGYHEVRIRHDSGKIRGMRVNRLVLMAFVGPCPLGMEACHFPDRDPGNNRLDNLRWDTKRENQRDQGRHGRRKILLPEQLAEVERLIAEGHPACEIARRMGVWPSCITKVIRREGFASPRPWVPPTRFDESLVAEMARLRREGLPDRKIAKILGMSHASIWRQLGPRSAAQFT